MCRVGIVRSFVSILLRFTICNVVSCIFESILFYSFKRYIHSSSINCGETYKWHGRTMFTRCIITHSRTHTTNVESFSISTIYSMDIEFFWKSKPFAFVRLNNNFFLIFSKLIFFYLKYLSIYYPRSVHM